MIFSVCLLSVKAGGSVGNHINTCRLCLVQGNRIALRHRLSGRRTGHLTGHPGHSLPAAPVTRDSGATSEHCRPPDYHSSLMLTFNFPRKFWRRATWFRGYPGIVGAGCHVCLISIGDLQRVHKQTDRRISCDQIVKVDGILKPQRDVVYIICWSSG